MATERLPMRKTLEILLLKWELRLSNREAARSAGVSPATVVNVLRRAASAGVTTYAQARAIGESDLEAALYPESAGAEGAARPEPDCAWIHRERSRPGVTLQLLHLEYLEANPGGLQYTAFCDRYREFIKRRGLVMRQHHVAGDKMFVDYSGKKPTLVDAVTGEVFEVELFPAAPDAAHDFKSLGFSSLSRVPPLPLFVPACLFSLQPQRDGLAVCRSWRAHMHNDRSSGRGQRRHGGFCA
jgi:hypothetical protein